MWIYNKINLHAGVKATIRDVFKKMRVPKGLRKLVKRITLDCIKCKIKTKKVSEVKMSTHNEATTVLAPPFHASMAMDLKVKMCLSFIQLEILWLIQGRISPL